MPLFDVSGMDLSPFLRSSVYLGYLLLVSSTTCLGFVPSLLDLAAAGSSVSVRSSSRLEFFMLLSCGLHTGLLMSPHSSGQLGPSAFVAGLVKAESVSSLLVVDKTLLGLLMSLKSFAQMDLAIFVLDHSMMGLLIPTRSPAQAGSLLLTFDVANIGLLISARNSARTELLLLIFGMLCVGLCFSLFVLDYLHLGFMLSVRGCARPESLAPAPDCTFLDLVVSLQSLACPGFSMSLSDASHSAPLVSLHSLA